MPEAQTESMTRSLDALVWTEDQRSTDILTQTFLKQLAETLCCEWAMYWKVTPAGLCPDLLWMSISVEPFGLIKDTTARTLSASEGNAGHVWKNGKPIWTQDIALNMCLPRSIDATEAGLRGGVWFAVKTERAVLGVIELLGKNPSRSTSELVSAVERLGIRLGQAFEL